jgi:hypothetical protein
VNKRAAEVPAFLAVVEVPTVAAGIDAKSGREAVHELEGVIAINAEAIEQVGIAGGGPLRSRVVREELGQIGSVRRSPAKVFTFVPGSAHHRACVKRPKQLRILTISVGGRDEAVCRG